MTALKAQEEEDYNNALFYYEKILLDAEKFNMNQEYCLMIVSNIAVIKAKQKCYDEAVYILKLLLKEKNIRKEIIYYNLSQIAKLNNNIAGYNKYQLLSYESDTSLYRVRETYKKRIEEIKLEIKDVSLIKMEDFIQQSDFLDHCHLLPEGQKKMADNIFKEISQKIKGKNKATLENTIFNPESFKGNFAPFDKYYKTFSPLNKKKIKAMFDEIFKENSESLNRKQLIHVTTASLYIDDSLKYYVKHPLFEVLSDIKTNSPKLPIDVGRFPEYFLVRIIISYLKDYEALIDIEDVFSSKILRKRKDLEKILPISNIYDLKACAEDINKKEDKIRFYRILKKCKAALVDHLAIGAQVFERKKTTIFWYFRETLRFGSHSRISMLYDRICLEYIAEGLAVAYLLNHKWNFKEKKTVIKLIKSLDDTVNLHEKFCLNIHLNNYDNKIIIDYDSKLVSLKSDVMALTIS